LMTTACSYRLEGLEPDNLLAFLALLGLLRALEADDQTRTDNERFHPRVAWDIDLPPVRPRLNVTREATQESISERAITGLETLAAAYDFDGRGDLNYARAECRSLLGKEAKVAQSSSRASVDLLAALMSDGAIKDDKEEAVDPTPLCLLFGQGHQHFLQRLAKLPHEVAPPARGRGKNSVIVSPADCLNEAIFQRWHRDDPTDSFRWDPNEDVRYALMAGDPTDSAYKGGTQHGANRLAAIGLAVLTVVPEHRAGRVRPAIIGGAFTKDGFSFAWPIWRDPTTLASIRALLGHPDLRNPAGLAYLGVDHVMVAKRISVGKFMNFSLGRPVDLP
jgi:hypothetical protein